MMCERVLSRRTQGELLARKQMVQEKIADSFIQIEQLRLLVLYAAWHIDKGDRDKARTYIAAVKVQAADVVHDVVRRAMHLHGSLGMSNEMPLASMWAGVPLMGVMEGRRPNPESRDTYYREGQTDADTRRAAGTDRFVPLAVAETGRDAGGRHRLR